MLNNLTFPLRRRSLFNSLTPSHEPVSQWNEQLLLDTLCEQICEVFFTLNLLHHDALFFPNVLLKEPMFHVNVFGS